VAAGRESRTSGIRALERDDLAGVCALFRQVVGPGDRTPDSRLAHYFRRIFFDDPWAEPAMSPLVYGAPDGEIVGFIGVSTRRMRLDGRPIRVAVSSNLIVKPDWRSRGVGALLLRRVLAGPQDLTLADQANNASRELWLRLGGQELVHASVGWYRVLRPGSAAGAMMERRGRRTAGHRLVRRGGRWGDEFARRLPRLASLEPSKPPGTVEPLLPCALLEQMTAAGRHLRLHPDYDAPYLGWLFAEIEALRSQGEVVAHQVQGPRGQAVGWFVYLLPEHRVVEVLQVGVLGEDRDLVLDHLFHQAWSEGAAVVHGRLEPATSGVLTQPGVVLRKYARALVHSPNPTVLALLGSTKALMSILDGEWIMSHPLHL
jgi:GNAT superfamily N-acetyltransferase